VIPSGADLLVTLALNNALADSNIRFIPTRHEQGAAFMADANLDRAPVRVPLNRRPLDPKFAVPAHGNRH